MGSTIIGILLVELFGHPLIDKINSLRKKQKSKKETENPS
jgi:hypothetical protein